MNASQNPHVDPCHQSIYPPGFVPNCNVMNKQWTYNASNGQCVEFYYHPCGEDRVGYDVFDTEEECSDSCMPKGTKIVDSLASLELASFISASIFQ